MNLTKLRLVPCLFVRMLYLGLKKFIKFLLNYRASLFYCLALIVLTFSWSYEYFKGSSSVACFFPTWRCPTFLQANAVLELIGTLGFSIGLIAVVYNYWDKHFLGLRYCDLVKYEFHSYHVCAIAHVISVACCVLSAEAKHSESALISLCSVIYGFVYQAIVVYWTVWNANKCADIAKMKYCELVATTLHCRDYKHNEELYKHVRKLSDTMPQPADRQYGVQLECFAKTLVAYVVSETRSLSDDSLKYQQVLSQIADVWTSIFYSPGPYDSHKDSVLFAVDVFSSMASIGRDTGDARFCANYSEQDIAWSWNQICSGYVVCRLNELRLSNSEQESQNILYQEITKILSILPDKQYMCYIKDALTSILVNIMLASFTAHAIAYNPHVIQIYKSHMLNRLIHNRVPNKEYIEIWKKRQIYWPLICEHLKFTISVNTDMSSSILKYTQKIDLGV